MLPPATETSALGLEWTTLQNNHEACERNALFIKMTAVALFAAGVALSFSTVLASFIVVILWVQEAITRTTQARLGTRLLHIEHMFKLDPMDDGGAFQLHSDWLAGRAGVSGLLAEYAASATRPTVAFPYVALLLVQWWLDAS
jgi:hypothetical protein